MGIGLYFTTKLATPLKTQNHFTRMADSSNPIKRVVAQLFPPSASSDSSKISINSPPNNIQQIFPISEFPCKTCETQCRVHPSYPSSIAKKIDRTLPLWGSVKAYKKHVLIATEGKSDWEFSLEEEKNTLGKHLWETLQNRGKQQINLTNVSMNSKGQGTDLVILPDFDYLSGATHQDAPAIVESLINDKWEPGLKVQKRDRRCGISGPILQQEFKKCLREMALLRNWDEDEKGSVGVFLCSHVGGHKFAGNVIVYRRDEQECIWLGRVEPCHVPQIVNETILHGRVWPELLRGGFRGHETSW